MNQFIKGARAILFLGLTAAILLILPQQVFAEETDVFSIPKTYAVQNRKYVLGNQITGYVGYMPMDSFTKGVQIGAVYTTYFTDFTGWEMINANYVYNMDTGLKKDILDISGGTAAADKIPDFPEFIITTNFVYTPIYSKNLFFNKDVIWGDLSLVAGGGIANYERAGISPIANFGAIMRFFTSEQSSYKIELREYVGFVTGGAEPFMSINVGYTYQFGSAKKKQGDQDDIEAEFNK